MSYVTQIVSFTTKGETDFKALASAAKVGTKGLRSQVFGVGVEESEARHWFLEWNTASKSGAPHVEKILKFATSDSIQNVHVVFNEPLAPSLAAPVTEIIFATTKARQDLITFGEIINVALRSTAGQPGCLGTSWGYTQENPRAAVLVIGWQNIGAHKRYTRTEVFKITTLPFFQGLSESKSTHYNFRHE